MTIDYAARVPDDWKRKIGWHTLSTEQQQAIGEFGFYMFGLGRHTVARIDEIKYDGRLVVLDDGSRWEVDSLDSADVDLWSPFIQVAVIDDVMYNLDDAEHADVREET